MNNIKEIVKPSLATADYVVIALYLTAVLGIGLFFFIQQIKRKKQNSVNNFFTGEGKNPIWVVSFSIWATILSSNFFLAATGNAIATRWMWAGANISLVGITPFIALFVVPFYRRLKESTAYSYLENRFNYATRVLASGLFIVFQIFRVAIVLYVPTLAMTTVSDVNPEFILLGLGIVVILITMFGGFKAVVWTDALQGLILGMGMVLVLFFALGKTNWSSSHVLLQKPLTIESWKVTLASGGIGFIFVYNIINSLYAFTSSQDVTQRYKGTKTIGEIRKTLYIAAGLGIFTVLIFFGAGAAIYTYVSSQESVTVKELKEIAKNADGKLPANLVGLQDSDLVGQLAGQKTIGQIDNVKAVPFFAKGGIEQGDKVFAYFVVKVLPQGVVGIIIAAVLAAAQSTISSGLSAVSNSIIVDFVDKTQWGKGLSAKYKANLSRLLVLLFGSVSLGGGLFLLATKQQQIFNYITGTVGLLNAPVVGVFVLGVFTKRVNGKGSVAGIVLGFLVAFPLWVFTQGFVPKELRIEFAGVWLTITSFLTAIITALVVSKLTGDAAAMNKSIANKSYWTRTKEFKYLTELEENLEQVSKLVKKGKLSKEFETRYYAVFEKMQHVVDAQ